MVTVLWTSNPSLPSKSTYWPADNFVAVFELPVESAVFATTIKASLASLAVNVLSSKSKESPTSKLIVILPPLTVVPSSTSLK